MKVTIISGASRGIGAAIAEDIKNEDGALIALSSKEVDFEDYNAVFEGTLSLLSCFQNITQINIVLCAAQMGTAHLLDEKQCEKLFKINVLGNLAVINAAKEQEVKMRIVWFAGGGAAKPLPEFFGYSLSKVAVVRAVENLSLILKNTSIVALGPGAVDTDMLQTVLNAGVTPNVRTDISEPVAFVRKFIKDEIDSEKYNGFFLHVRDDLSTFDGKKFKLRRIE
jgi:NAD(P)-dependent dehydrogenase (short-subunit alcohol dehydrogenase family)